jgi:hypothetical protein
MISWSSIALGVDWSGKSMNHFVGWAFFSVGGLNSLGQPSSARRTNFQELENETCSGIFCWILETGWNSCGFLLDRFLSLHQLCFHRILMRRFSFFSGGQQRRNLPEFQPLPSTQQTLQISLTIPSQPPEKFPKSLETSSQKSSGKIALTIEHFHDSSRQKRAIRNFRFVVHFSSREFEIGCQVLFSDLMHYSQNSRLKFPVFEQFSGQD